MREIELKNAARVIFAEALKSADANAAIRRTIRFSGKTDLQIGGETYDLANDFANIFAVAVGKAAFPMALALDKILGGKLKGGVVSGVPTEQTNAEIKNLSSKWRVFEGGHPLPNESSLAAAQSAFELLKEADDEKTLVIFLISGGGSAMFEMPVDDSISLADLREANRVLVGCGASIGEINTIRRAFSKVKGAGLAGFAPRAAQVSLIISDTQTSDEKSVASGLTYASEPLDSNELNSILSRYDLTKKLPASIVDLLSRQSSAKIETPKKLRRFCTLLNNENAVKYAAEYAATLGFKVEIAGEISGQNVEIGVAEIVGRMNDLLTEVKKGEVACLVSGGEFSCPARGAGIGGRNSETVLRMALMMGENKINCRETAFLSAGTDGIDGNSLAAGAICDAQTIARAQELNLNAQKYLENSDSFNFFNELGATITTGATGTNVRDLRILLARK